MDSGFGGGGGGIYSRNIFSFLFVSGNGDDDLPGEGIGGCAFQMLVYCRSLVGVTCSLRKNRKRC